MGNPIQYHNTNNRGGFVKRLQYVPPRGIPRGGVNENLTPAVEINHLGPGVCVCVCVCVSVCVCPPPGPRGRPSWTHPQDTHMYREV